MGSVLETCRLEAWPCALKEGDYRVVVLHVGVVQLHMGEGRASTAIGTLGFRDSDKGNWFVAVEPGGREGEVVAGSAESFGFRREGEGWVWGEEGAACLGEKAALASLLDSFGSSEGLVVVTPREGEGLDLLLAAMETHGLIQQLQERVKGVGSVEGVLASRSLLKMETQGLQQLQDFASTHLGRQVDLSRPQLVPKAMMQLLEQVLPSLSFKDLVKPHLHPLLSPCTHSKLQASNLPTISALCHPLRLKEPLVLPPGGQHLLTMTMEPGAKREIGQPLDFIGFWGLELFAEILRLGRSLKVTLTVRNSGEGRLELGEGERIGVAWRKGVLEFPQASTNIKLKKSIGDKCKSESNIRDTGANIKLGANRSKPEDANRSKPEDANRSKPEDANRSRSAYSTQINSMKEAKAVEKSVLPIAVACATEDFPILTRKPVDSEAIRKEIAKLSKLLELKEKEKQKRMSAENDEQNAKGSSLLDKYKAKKAKISQEKSRSTQHEVVQIDSSSVLEMVPVLARSTSQDLLESDVVPFADSTGSSVKTGKILHRNKSAVESHNEPVASSPSLTTSVFTEPQNSESNSTGPAKATNSSSVNVSSKPASSVSASPNEIICHPDIQCVELDAPLPDEPGPSNIVFHRKALSLAAKDKSSESIAEKFNPSKQPEVEVINIDESDTEDILDVEETNPEDMVGIDESDSEEEELVRLMDPEDKVAPTSEPLIIDEDSIIEEIQIERQSCDDTVETDASQDFNVERQIEVLEVEDDEETIEILPTDQNKVRFTRDGYAVADPEALRQTIEAYKKRKVQAKPRSIQESQKTREALPVVDQLSECELQILEECSESALELIDQTPNDDLEIIEHTPNDDLEIIEQTHNDDLEIIEQTPNEDLEIIDHTTDDDLEILEVCKSRSDEPTVPVLEEVGKETVTLDDVENSEDGNLAQILELAPDSDKGVACSENGDTYNTLEIGLDIDDESSQIRDETMNNQTVVESVSFTSKSQTNDEKPLENEDQIIEISNKTGDQSSPANEMIVESNKVIPNGELIQAVFETESEEEETTDFGNELDMLDSSESSDEHGGREFDLDFSSGDDAEKLECKPDLESMVEYEKKKKIDLRKKKEQSDEDVETRSNSSFESEITKTKTGPIILVEDQSKTPEQSDEDAETRSNSSFESEITKTKTGPIILVEDQSITPECLNPSAQKHCNFNSKTGSIKSCKAASVYGPYHKDLWCKSCRRKQKCLRVKMFQNGKSLEEIDGTSFDFKGEVAYKENCKVDPSDTIINKKTTNEQQAAEILLQMKNLKPVILEPREDSLYVLQSEAEEDFPEDQDATRSGSKKPVKITEEGVAYTVTYTHPQAGMRKEAVMEDHSGTFPQPEAQVVSHPLSLEQLKKRNVHWEEPKKVDTEQSDMMLQILNPKTVAVKERIFFGPINKVVENGKLVWRCDYCSKTHPGYAIILKHILGHNSVNNFFCPYCDTSLKTKQTLNRHMKRCKTNKINTEYQKEHTAEQTLENNNQHHNIEDEDDGNLDFDLDILSDSENETDENTNYDEDLTRSMDHVPPKTPDSGKKRKRFASSSTSSGVTLAKKPNMQMKLTFVDDVSVPQLESVHYKALTGKMGPEVAILKYVCPSGMIEAKLEHLKSEGESDKQPEGEIEPMEADLDIALTDQSFSIDTVDMKPASLPMPAWQIPVDPALPLISQLRKLSKNLAAERPDQGPDLCFEFSCLLSYPQFEPLIRTYLRLLNLPLDALHPNQRQFPETIVTELATAGLEQLRGNCGIISMFDKLVVELPRASILDWEEALKSKMACLSQAAQMDSTFSIQMFIVVVLMHCLISV